MDRQAGEEATSEAGVDHGSPTVEESPPEEEQAEEYAPAILLVSSSLQCDVVRWTVRLLLLHHPPTGQLCSADASRHCEDGEWHRSSGCLLRQQTLRRYRLDRNSCTDRES